MCENGTLEGIVEYQWNADANANVEQCISYYGPSCKNVTLRPYLAARLNSINHRSFVSKFRILTNVKRQGSCRKNCWFAAQI